MRDARGGDGLRPARDSHKSGSQECAALSDRAPDFLEPASFVKKSPPTAEVIRVLPLKACGQSPQWSETTFRRIRGVARMGRFGAGHRRRKASLLCAPPSSWKPGEAKIPRVGVRGENAWGKARPSLPLLPPRNRVFPAPELSPRRYRHVGRYHRAGDDRP